MVKSIKKLIASESCVFHIYNFKLLCLSFNCVELFTNYKKKNACICMYIFKKNVTFIY